MKTITMLFALTVLAFNGHSQINSNPGSHQWTSTAAWAGGSVPGPTDNVVITPNSSINLDVTLVHYADITVQGSFTCINPMVSLTINNGDLTISSGGVNFSGSIGASPITVNGGHVTNNGLYQSGDLFISFTGVIGQSLNAGDFMVSGDMELAGAATFQNNLAVIVSNQLTINSGCTMTSNQYVTSNTVFNDGTINNNAYVSIDDSVHNSISGVIMSSGTTFSIGSWLDNVGAVTIDDSMWIGTNLVNTGAFTNNGGACGIGNDYENFGTTTGSLNGQFWVANESTNHQYGIINGDIDICDATLVGGNHLDTDLNIPNVDFGTVTFCGQISSASLNDDNFTHADISPNPTSGILHIDGVDSGEYAIYSLDGKLMEISAITASTLVDLTDLPSGMYQLVVSTDQGVVTQKIIKE